MIMLLYLLIGLLSYPLYILYKLLTFYENNYNGNFFLINKRYHKFSCLINKIKPCIFITNNFLKRFAIILLTPIFIIFWLLNNKFFNVFILILRFFIGLLLYPIYIFYKLLKFYEENFKKKSFFINKSYINKSSWSINQIRRCISITNNVLKKITVLLLTPIAIIFWLLNYKFLNVSYVDALGHLTIEPFYYLNEYNVYPNSKYKVIIAIANKKIFNLIPKKIAPNNSLLKYWKKYFVVITSPLLNILLTPFQKHPLIKISVRNYIADYWYPSKIFNIIRKENNLKHFLKLKENHTNEKNLLSKMDIPKDAWYVCFACRESGYYNQENINNSKCRCSNPKELELAFMEIIKRGGWIIRMGSPKMNPLPENILKLKKIIDYPKTKFVSDSMDIFLSATCRFFIGSSSGIIGLPLIFNVPLLLVNTIPLCHSGFNRQDLVLFKLYRSKKPKKFIPFHEIVKTPSANYALDVEFDRDDIELIDNSPEELKDATIEMLNRLDGIQTYTKYEEDLQENMHSLFQPHNFCYKTPVRFGNEFLKKYSFLLNLNYEKI